MASLAFRMRARWVQGIADVRWPAPSDHARRRPDRRPARRRWVAPRRRLTGRPAAAAALAVGCPIAPSTTAGPIGAPASALTVLGEVSRIAWNLSARRSAVNSAGSGSTHRAVGRHRLDPIPLGQQRVRQGGPGDVRARQQHRFAGLSGWPERGHRVRGSRTGGTEIDRQSGRPQRRGGAGADGGHPGVRRNRGVDPQFRRPPDDGVDRVRRREADPAEPTAAEIDQREVERTGVRRRRDRNQRHRNRFRAHGSQQRGQFAGLVDGSGYQHPPAGQGAGHGLARHRTPPRQWCSAGLAAHRAAPSSSAAPERATPAPALVRRRPRPRPHRTARRRPGCCRRPRSPRR